MYFQYIIYWIILQIVYTIILSFATKLSDENDKSRYSFIYNMIKIKRQYYDDFNCRCISNVVFILVTTKPLKQLCLKG